MSEWVDVKTRVPNKKGYFLAYVLAPNGPEQQILYFDPTTKAVPNEMGFNKKCCTTVTHWMKLPKPPYTVDRIVEMKYRK